MWGPIIYYGLCLLLVPVLGSALGLIGLRLLLPVMQKQSGTNPPSSAIINLARHTVEFLNGCGSAILAILLAHMLHQEFGLKTLLILLPKPIIEMATKKSLAVLPTHVAGIFSVYGILQLYLAA